MTHFLHFRFTFASLTLITAIALAGPVLAQDDNGASIWSIPAPTGTPETDNGASIWSIPAPTGAPETSEGTSQLDMSAIQKARAFTEGKLGALEAQGHMGPLVKNISNYSDATVTGLHDLMNKHNDPCTQAVRASIYLDAHLEEADWTQRLSGYERLPEAALEILISHHKPTSRDVLVSIFTKLSKIDNVLKVYDAYQTAQKYYTKTPEVRKGIWTNEIVTQAGDSNWTEGDIEKRRAALLADAQVAAEEMLDVQERITEALQNVDTRYTVAVQTAEYELKRDHKRVYAKVTGRELEDVTDEEVAMLLDINKYPALKRDYNNKLAAAAELKIDEHKTVVDKSYTLMRESQYATEKALKIGRAHV